MTDDKIKQAVGRWLGHWVEQCKKDHGVEKCPTYADVTHSALLSRLLSGKAPTGHVPPLAFAYPWHELEEGNACSIRERDICVDSSSVRICQSGYTRDNWNEESCTGILRSNHNGQLYDVFIEKQTRMIRKVEP